MKLCKIFFAVGLIVLISCGANQPTVTIDERAGAESVNVPETPTSARWNEDFDPLMLGDSKLEIEAKKPVDDVADIDQILQSGADTESATERSQVKGFRVQLISTRSEEEARAVMRNAVISFSEPVYRDYDNPYYKIRVGDFKSRYEASKVQEQAITFGFHEAWVVRALIWDRPARQGDAQ